MSSKGIEFLLPIKPYLASFNTILTVLLNVAPITKFINISRGKEPYTNIPFLMLIINIVNNIVWSCYWIKENEFISFLSSFISGFFSTTYILWYNYFASNKNKCKFVIYILIQVVCEVVSTLFYIIFPFRHFKIASSGIDNDSYHHFSICSTSSKCSQSF